MLELPEQKEVGKYGRLHLEYLKAHRKGCYTNLLSEGTLNQRLYDIDVEAKTMVEIIITRLAIERGIDENLKVRDMLRWVTEMNNIKAMTESRRLRERGLRGEKGDNVMLRGRRNHTLFLRYLDYGEAIGEKNDKLSGKKVSISMNYETEHFKEMIILAGMIKAAGGEYVLKASTVDTFATFDAIDEDGNPRRCSRGEYVKAEIESGRSIEIMTLDDLLNLLGTSREELENASPIDVEYLEDNKYKR